MDDIAVDIGEPYVAAAVAEGELFVAKPHEVQDGSAIVVVSREFTMCSMVRNKNKQCVVGDAQFIEFVEHGALAFWRLLKLLQYACCMRRVVFAIAPQDFQPWNLQVRICASVADEMRVCG